MPVTTPVISSSGRGGARPNSGRKPKTQQADAYTRLAEARAKKETYLAQMAELDYKVRAKELIPADVVVSHWQNILGNMRSRLLSVPTQLASTCAGLDAVDVEKRATAIIRECLEELSKHGEY